MATSPPMSPKTTDHGVPSKVETTADTAEIPSSPKSVTTNGKEAVDDEHMGGATLSLLMGTFFPCLPVAVVSAVLLSLIFRNEIKAPYTVVQQGSQAYSTNVINQTFTELEQGGSDVYWVWATTATTPGTLHTIASVTSKVMPFVTSTSMALVAFLAGRRIMQATQRVDRNSMPTPHQMSLLISLLNGSSFSPLYRTLEYRWHSSIKLVKPVIFAFWSLTWIVMITLAIGGVDSWFGVAVQPATVDILKLSNTTSAFGRQMDPSICGSLSHQLPCIGNGSATCDYPCSITTWQTPFGTQRFGLQNAQLGAETLMNNSYSDFVVNVSTKNYDTQHFFLGDINVSPTHDFDADTLAVSTECRVITQNCTIGTGFTCPPYSAPSFAWSGAVGVDPTSATGSLNESNVGIQFFDNNGHSAPVGLKGSKDLFTSQNPAPFLVWSKGFPPIDTTADQFAYMRDNKYIGTDISDDPVFILSCEMSIYEGTYSWRDGGVQAGGLYNLKLADPAYGAIYSGAFAMDTALGHLSLQTSAALAAYQGRPEGLANVFANQFSRAAVAMTAGISVPAVNIFDQERYNNVLVTVVPKAPLWTLVALKALYALSALVLAGIAVMMAEPSKSQDIKERLTVEGLAAGLFEADADRKPGVSEVEHLFDEHRDMHGKGSSKAKKKSEAALAEVPKIGMVQNERGGWVWASSATTSGLVTLSTQKRDAC